MKQRDNNNSGTSSGTTKQPREKVPENNFTPWYNQGVGGYDDPSLLYGDQNPFPLFQDIHGKEESDPLAEGYETEQYEVEPGDSIVGIAEKYNISPEELLSLNNWTLEDPVKGILSSGGETFQLQPGWYVRVPLPNKPQPGPFSFSLEPGSQDEFYHVQKGDTYQTIAEFYNLTIEQLLYYNELKVDEERGEVLTRRGDAFVLSPGVQLLIPAANKNVSPEEANKVAQDAAAAAAGQENKHMEAFFASLLAGSENLLGVQEGSQLAYSLGIEIPVAPGLDLTMGGKFEQKRKPDEVVEHKISLSIGLEIEVSSLVSASVDFTVSIHAASKDVNEAVDLFSYGFYKFGRQAADNLNDWENLGPNIATTSLSAGLYYGLNYMYSDKSDFMDKFKDDDGTDKKMVELEKELFDYQGEYANDPFDKDNKNEVGFGGSIKGSAEAGNDRIGAKAGVSAEIALQNTISAETLNKTGIYGAQEEMGFFEDYDVGSKSTLTAKYGGEASIDGTGVAYSSSISFERYNEDDSAKEQSKYGSSEKDKGWQFSKMETQGSIQIADLTRKNMVTNEILTSLHAMAEKIGEKYNTTKENSKKFDKEASVQKVYVSGFDDKINMSILDQSMATMEDMTKNSPIKVTDALKAELKIVHVKDATKPQITLTIGRLKEKSLNFGVGEAGMMNLKVIKTFDLT